MTIETNIKKLLTVGIPFYDGSNIKNLQDSIDSIIKQTLPPDCIHLIQDGPINHKMKNLIDEYEKRYSNIKSLKLPKKGLPYALNQSIMQTETKYYARMDCDDISLPNRLEKQVEYLDKNLDIDMLGGWSIEFSQDIQKEKGFINKRPSTYKKVKEYFHYRSSFIHPTLVLRMTVFDKIGYYDENFLTAQDLEFCARALKKNIKISNLQEPLLYYRIKGVQFRRSDLKAIKRQIIAKYSYNTLSIKLNVLKIASIIFRFFPQKIRIWAYNNLR